MARREVLISLAGALLAVTGSGNAAAGAARADGPAGRARPAAPAGPCIVPAAAAVAGCDAPAPQLRAPRTQPRTQPRTPPPRGLAPMPQSGTPCIAPAVLRGDADLGP